MNSDDKKPEMENSISPELEARIVAWVAGEASAFEAAELERLVKEQPELAVFKRRIAAVQGLVAEAVRPEKAPFRLALSAGQSCSKRSVWKETSARSRNRNASLFISCRRAPEETARVPMDDGRSGVPGVWVPSLAMSIPAFQKVRYESFAKQKQFAQKEADDGRG